MLHIGYHNAFASRHRALQHYPNAGPHLWRVDDSRELCDAIHAQVGDGEGPSSELLWLQLASLCLHKRCTKSAMPANSMAPLCMVFISQIKFTVQVVYMDTTDLV